MSRAAFGALWLQILLLPCEFFLYMPESGEFPKIGTLGRLAGIIAFPLGLLEIFRRGRMRPLAPFHAFIGLFVLWSWLTMFWSVEPEATWTRSWTYFQLAALAWLIWELAPTEALQRHLLQAYVLGAFIASFDTVSNFVAGSTVATGRFAATGFGPNDLGFTLVIAMPIAYYLALTHPRRAMRWANLFYLPFSMVAVLLTASRGALISAALALLIVPWTLPRQSSSVRWGMGLLVLVSALVIYQFVPATSWKRLATVTEEIESGSFNERDRIWDAGLEVFVQHPIVGVGAGVFGAVVQPILGAPRAAHQTFLSVAVGQGFVGLALFLGIFAAAFLPVRRMDPLRRALWGAMLLTLAVGLQPRTWDYRKPLWFLLGTLAAQAMAVPAASAAAGRASQRLLVRRSGSLWSMPGGHRTPEEAPGDAAGIWASTPPPRSLP